MKYAEKTKVPVEKTRMEIERLLRSKGVHETATAWTRKLGIVGFQHAGRVFRFEMPMPQFEGFATFPGRKWKTRTEQQQREAWEQACREAWRQILLIIKARIVAIETGAETWEVAFLAYTVGPNGEVIGPRIVAELAKAYAGAAELPPMLPADTQQQ